MGPFLFAITPILFVLTIHLIVGILNTSASKGD